MGKKKASKCTRMETNVEDNAGIGNFNNLKENEVIYTAEIHKNNIDEQCTIRNAQNLKLQGLQDDVKENISFAGTNVYSLGQKVAKVLQNAQTEQTTLETDLMFSQVTHI